MNVTATIPEPFARLENEWDLLLAACSQATSQEKTNRIRSFLQGEIRWPTLLQLADHHGISSLLYQAFSTIENEIPPTEIASLRQRHQTNLHKALFLARELIRILDCLESLAIEVMPYKGVALAETMYGDIALRQSGDIDLLIHGKDLPRIRNAVRELGYTPHLPLSEAEERSYLRSGYECAFDGTAGRNLLEVQWALQPRFYAVDLDMEALFQRATTVTVAGRSMQTPSPEDSLLVLSLHAAKHVWGRLIWTCDIAQIIKLPSLNWAQVSAQARMLGVERILRVTLFLGEKLLGATIPEAIRSDVHEDRAAQALADEIKTQLISGAALDVESLAYFRLMLRLRERRTDRMRFLQRLALTPGPNEWKTIRLPAPLFPLYRLVRISRLAARLART
jgi:hypothetical protein